MRRRRVMNVGGPSVLAVFVRDPEDPAVRAHGSFNEHTDNAWEMPVATWGAQPGHATPHRESDWSVLVVFADGLMGIARTSHIDPALRALGIRRVT